MDTKVLSVLIGASIALLGSVITQFLVYYIQVRLKRKDALRESYQFAVIFLEKLKIEGAESVSNGYYDLVGHIIMLPEHHRKMIINAYGQATKAGDSVNVAKEISKVQEALSKSIL